MRRRRSSDRLIEHVIEHVENGNYALAITMLKNIVANDRRSMEDRDV